MVIVYGVVQRYGIDGLMVATMMAGLILIALGVARLGAVIKFIPFPVTLGFTSGIAVVIFSSQIGDLLGLQTGPVPAEFLAKWGVYAAHLASLDVQTVGVAALSLAIVLYWPKVSRKLPSPFAAIIAMTAVVQIAGLDVATIGSRFGGIPSSLPTPRLPSVDLATVSSLVGPAFAIAMLGAIESLLSAVIADGMTGGRHRSNAELVAQGIANFTAPLFGGMPATGALARTAANIRSGARTPVAGIVHALTLLLITLFFGRWAAWIPMATLAAILVVVAYHMSEWRRFKAEFGAPRSDIIVLLVTFLLTVVVGLTVAIQVGMVLAAFLFMRRMSEVTNVAAVTAEFAGHPAAGPAGELRPSVPAGVEIYEINGPFFFGAAEKFKDTMSAIAKPPAVLILRLRDVLTMDSTGMHALRDLIRRTRRDGTLVLLAEVRSHPLMAMGRSRLLDEIGEDNLCGSVEEALLRAREVVAA